MTVNLYPDSEILSDAMVDLVTDYDWKTYTVLYDSDDALIRLKDVLGKHEPSDSPITVRQLDDDIDQRPLLKSLQDMGESRIIIDIHSDRVIEILRQAAEVKLLGDYVSYIVVDLNTHTVDFEEILYSGTNITSVRLVHPDEDEMIYMTQLWKRDPELKQHGVKTDV